MPGEGRCPTPLCLPTSDLGRERQRAFYENAWRVPDYRDRGYPQPLRQQHRDMPRCNSAPPWSKLSLRSIDLGPDWDWNREVRPSGYERGNRDVAQPHAGWRRHETDRAASAPGRTLHGPYRTTWTLGRRRSPQAG